MRADTNEKRLQGYNGQTVVTFIGTFLAYSCCCFAGSLDGICRFLYSSSSHFFFSQWLSLLIQENISGPAPSRCTSYLVWEIFAIGKKWMKLLGLQVCQLVTMLCLAPWGEWERIPTGQQFLKLWSPILPVSNWGKQEWEKFPSENKFKRLLAKKVLLWINIILWQ